MGAVDYTPAEVERVPANGQTATIQRSLRTCINHTARLVALTNEKRTSQFSPPTTRCQSSNGVVAEHAPFFFDDNGYIHSGLALRLLSCGLVLLAAEQSSLGSCWTESANFSSLLLRSSSP
jgi:hypothetical protein